MQMSRIDDPEIYRIVLNSLQTGVYVTDCCGKVLFWNSGAERITGYMSHEVIGHLSRESILAGCTERNCPSCGDVCPVAETMHQGRAQEARIYLHHRSGHW